jgi:hypothetical protein
MESVTSCNNSQKLASFFSKHFCQISRVNLIIGVASYYAQVVLKLHGAERNNVGTVRMSNLTGSDKRHMQTSLPWAGFKLTNLTSAPYTARNLRASTQNLHRGRVFLNALYLRALRRVRDLLTCSRIFALLTQNLENKTSDPRGTYSVFKMEDSNVFITATPKELLFCDFMMLYAYVILLLLLICEKFR